jgi:endonuclease/exonuclease/phosphatase family metal-dependent hydrolase
VATVVSSPEGDLIVYGTVIAWANEPFCDDGDPARMWQVHAAEIDRQGAEWARLRAQHPELPLVVAGDFNQNRDGARWYGTHAVRDSMTRQLRSAGLRCLTDVDVVAAGMLGSHHLVDHICVSPDLDLVGDLQCWEPREASTSVRLSDHPTVLVTLRKAGHAMSNPIES